MVALIPFKDLASGQNRVGVIFFCGISLVAELVLAKHRVTVRFCHTADHTWRSVGAVDRGTLEKY